MKSYQSSIYYPTLKCTYLDQVIFMSEVQLCIYKIQVNTCDNSAHSVSLDQVCKFCKDQKT